MKMKNSKKGMEMVQVGIMVGIAVFLGLIFKDQLKTFIDSVFATLATMKF